MTPRLLQWQDMFGFVGPLETVGAHEHRCAAVLLALDGPFRIRAAGSEWVACEGALLAAGLLHELDCNRRPLAVIYFDPLAHGPLLPSGEMRPLPRRADWLRRGREGLREPGTDRAALREQLLGELLPRTGQLATALHDARLRELRQLLAQPDRAPMPLPRTAQLLGMSGSRFSHLFAGRAGVSWTAYRNWTRLTRATTELAGSPQTLTHIALDHGYSSPAHFAASFRAGFGITPSQLRSMQPRIESLPARAADF